MEKKKTKLTISGDLKKSKSSIELAKSRSKNSVIVQKKTSKFGIKPRFSKPTGGNAFKSTSKIKNSFFSRSTKSLPNDFEKRKLAEQRATRKLKGVTPSRDTKGKSGVKRRELKLTLSRALSDDVELKGRSLASLKRAKLKENRDSQNQDNKENFKPIK